MRPSALPEGGGEGGRPPSQPSQKRESERNRSDHREGKHPVQKARLVLLGRKVPEQSRGQAERRPPSEEEESAQHRGGDADLRVVVEVSNDEPEQESDPVVEERADEQEKGVRKQGRRKGLPRRR